MLVGVLEGAIQSDLGCVCKRWCRRCVCVTWSVWMLLFSVV